MIKNYILEEEAHQVLQQLSNCLDSLTNEEYTEKILVFENMSIGEHSRHIIELFQQLLLGYDLGIINYDARKRDKLLQQDILFAKQSIKALITELKRKNKSLQLFTTYNNKQSIETNYYRELMYNIEHCIHHQAIIKIGLYYLEKNCSIENFGIAKSTIEYRNK